VNLEVDLIGKYVETAGYRLASRYQRRRYAMMRLATTPSARVGAALAAIRAGKMVIMVDDEDRENEGDLVLAADKVTPEAINFMATHARGLICLAMDGR
jgi:hypothetical protein